MKKSIILSMAVIGMCVAFTGCGKKEEVANNAVSGSEQQVVEQTKVGTASLPKVFAGKASEKFFETMQGNKHYLKMSSELDGKETIIEIAQDGKNIYMDMSYPDEPGFTTLTKDGKMYMIDRSSKTVMYIGGDTDSEDEDGLFDSFDYSDIDENSITYNEGKEVFMGKEYSYDEFKTANIDDTTDTIRVYYEGDKIVGFKTVETDEEVKIIEMSEEIPSGIFEIPADYEMQDLTNLDLSDLGIDYKGEDE